MKPRPTARASTPFPNSPAGIPAISAQQMREVDRAMMEDFGISLWQMMENAGRHLAEVARQVFLEGAIARKRVLILAGRGGNGGGGLVAARHLANGGATVTVWTTTTRDNYFGVPKQQLEILKKLPVTILEESPTQNTGAFDVILDSLIGYSLAGEPRGLAREYIYWANQNASPILSLDAPSGLDVTTGRASETTIIADATLTLALPKLGLLKPEARPFVGQLFLGDIGVPPVLYGRAPLHLDVPPIFSKGPILKIA